MTHIPLLQLPLGVQAEITWKRAKEGREFARLNFRSAAVIRMEELRGFHNPKFNSLNRIASEAVLDINRLLICPVEGSAA